MWVVCAHNMWVMYGGQRSTLGIFPIALHFDFLRLLPLTEAGAIHSSRWLANEFKGSFYLVLQIRIAVPSFYMGARELNSWSHVKWQSFYWLSPISLAQVGPLTQKEIWLLWAC